MKHRPYYCPGFALGYVDTAMDIETEAAVKSSNIFIQLIVSFSLVKQEQRSRGRKQLC